MSEHNAERPGEAASPPPPQEPASTRAPFEWSRPAGPETPPPAEHPAAPGPSIGPGAAPGAPAIQGMATAAPAGDVGTVTSQSVIGQPLGPTTAEQQGWPAPRNPMEPVPARRSGLPGWLSAGLLAIIPAAIVGAAVFFLTREDSGGNSDAAGIIDGFIRFGGDDDDIQTMVTALPAGYPGDLPTYTGAELVVSFVIDSDDGANYFAIFSTKDPLDKVMTFYRSAVDKDPWQMVLARESGTTGGVQFSRPADPDVEGSISIHKSDVGGATSIFVSIANYAQASRSPATKPFVLRPTVPVPSGFPSEVPIYKKDSGSTVIETYFERGAGTNNYLISFLTKDREDDVIDFYRDEFAKRGWQVVDGDITSASSFELSIDFRDGPREEVQGSIRADAFEEDRSYTRVDMLVTVSITRGRGN